MAGCQENQPWNQNVGTFSSTLRPLWIREGLETEFNYVANGTVSQWLGNVTPTKTLDIEARLRFLVDEHFNVLGGR